jgi:hypothetical protein
MNKFTVELEWDAVDSIVVQVLKNQYNGLKEDLDRRRNDEETLGIFSNDKEEDVACIWRHLDSIKIVLSYNMNHEDFEEWAKDVVAVNGCDDFSQEHMGEYIVDTASINEDEMLVVFDKDNDYLKDWSKEQKIEWVRKTSGSIMGDTLEYDR